MSCLAWYDTRKGDQMKIGLIQDAIELYRRIGFDYYSPSGETKREIEPEYVRNKRCQIACDMAKKYEGK